jgi:ribosomal protein S18 acetylase RimI-like enzyme
MILMGIFNYIDTFFFISLGITFILILLLVYHFKQRLSTIEQKSDTMFDIINSTDMEGKLLKDINYFVMAQICIDKQFRGIGIFKALYYSLADQMGSSFEKVIIEVSPNNIKSMFAHQNIGFEVINTVKNKEGLVDWNVMSWDMN